MLGICLVGTVDTHAGMGVKSCFWQLLWNAICVENALAGHSKFLIHLVDSLSLMMSHRYLFVNNFIYPSITPLHLTKFQDIHLSNTTLAPSRWSAIILTRRNEGNWGGHTHELAQNWQKHESFLSTWYCSIMVPKQVSDNCCGMPFCVENALAGHSKFLIHLVGTLSLMMSHRYHIC